MKQDFSKYESGQAIVIMALVMVILIGALGLAIDGGRLFFLWRDAQNATDAAVLTGAYNLCVKATPDAVINSSKAVAGENGFWDGQNNVVVNVYNPPVQGPKVGDYKYVEVNIDAAIAPYFIQFVYGGDLRVQTSAIAFCNPEFNPDKVAGIWAGATDCGTAFSRTGSSGYIESDLFSNKDMIFNPSSAAGSLIVKGEAYAAGTVYNPSDKTTFINATNAPTNGVAVAKDSPMSWLTMDYFAPGGEIAKYVGDADYHVIDDLSDPDTRMHRGELIWDPGRITIEGLYYVTGNVSIGNHPNIGARGVTVVASGDINITRSGEINFFNKLLGSKASGMLFMTPLSSETCGTPVIDFQDAGSDDLRIWGILNAPKGNVNISGSNVWMKGAIFAWTINSSGSHFEFYKDPSIMPRIPPSVQVAQ